MAAVTVSGGMFFLLWSTQFEEIKVFVPSFHHFPRSFRGKLRGTISPATGQAPPINFVGERLEMMQLMSHYVSFVTHFR